MDEKQKRRTSKGGDGDNSPEMALPQSKREAIHPQTPRRANPDIQRGKYSAVEGTLAELTGRGGANTAQYGVGVCVNASTWTRNNLIGEYEYEYCTR